MIDIFNLLKESPIVRDAEILSLLQGGNFYYLKMKAFIINGTLLFIKIYLSDTEYDYSFHWQDNQGILISRWDNAPHHSGIGTYPHHIHTPIGINDSYEITLQDVLGQIKKKIG
ncbi:MAG: hypothetical protein QG657_1222 [Acidobacteriota bacterium]|nr:hypothetical protein [Acidobacteriota bacterium]